MHRSPTIRTLVPWLIGLFVVAQLAGMVPFRQAIAWEPPSHLGNILGHDHHVAGHSGHHHHGVVDLEGACCALHAFLTGILPDVAAAAPADITRARLAVISEDRLAGIDPGLPDRPPRPLL